MMWILKGTLLGLWLLGFATMAWLYFTVYRNLPLNSGVDITVITGCTIQNPLWWNRSGSPSCFRLCDRPLVVESCHSVDRIAGDWLDPGRIPRVIHHAGSEITTLHSRSLVN
jgi:hypothetical protein